VTDQDPFDQNFPVDFLTSEEQSADSNYIPFRLFTSISEVEQGAPVKATQHWFTSSVGMFFSIGSAVLKFNEKKDFEKTKQKVNDLVLMDQDILRGISQIQQQLQLTQVNILNYIGQLAVNQYITAIIAKI
jgi:hypothetical protein